jgi:hypothetical protein
MRVFPDAGPAGKPIWPSELAGHHSHVPWQLTFLWLQTSS